MVQIIRFYKSVDRRDFSLEFDASWEQSWHVLADLGNKKVKIIQYIGVYRIRVITLQCFTME